MGQAQSARARLHYARRHPLDQRIGGDRLSALVQHCRRNADSLQRGDRRLHPLEGHAIGQHRRPREMRPQPVEPLDGVSLRRPLLQPALAMENQQVACRHLDIGGDAPSVTLRFPVADADRVGLPLLAGENVEIGQEPRMLRPLQSGGPVVVPGITALDIAGGQFLKRRRRHPPYGTVAYREQHAPRDIGNAVELLQHSWPEFRDRARLIDAVE